MASSHPKVETFATLSAEVAEYRRAFPMMQAQAQQAMMMAAQEKGKYLHVLKLFAALVAQNMQSGIPSIVLHKSIVDQPDTLNIAREGYPDEKAELGYTYRVVSDAELEALNNPNPDGDVHDREINPEVSEGGGGDSGIHDAADESDAGAPSDGVPAVGVSKAARGDSRKVLRKKKK